MIQKQEWTYIEADPKTEWHVLEYADSSVGIYDTTYAHCVGPEDFPDWDDPIEYIDDEDGPNMRCKVCGEWRY
jgi:hypothetical protein